MEERRELFDASAYMLFEASGDSEAAYFDQESDAAAEEEDDDDAQSCSYRSSCRTAARLREAVAGGDEIRGGEFDYRSGDDDEEEEDGEASDDEDGEASDDEDGVVDQCRIRRLKAAAEPAKSKGCEESNVMMMNEREGDKLFWEACLAS